MLNRIVNKIKLCLDKTSLELNQVNWKVTCHYCREFEQCSKWKSDGSPRNPTSTDIFQISANNISSANMTLMSNNVMVSENDHDCCYVDRHDTVHLGKICLRRSNCVLLRKR